MSEGDLMNTDWVDSYTGEQEVPVENRDLEVYLEVLDDELEENPKLRRHYRAMQLLLKAIFWDDPELRKQQKLHQSDVHREIIRWANEARDELGYDDEWIQKFIGAQIEGFDSESEAEIIPDDETDAYTPPPLLKDFEINPVAWEQIGPVVGMFQSRRNRAFEKCAQKHLTRDGAIAYFKTNVLNPKYVNYLRSQLYLASRGDITTAAVATSRCLATSASRKSGSRCTTRMRNRGCRCMHLVIRPEIFDVLLLPNLYGDIVSDLCAGLVGALGVVPGVNYGTDAAVFEAVHGTAPDIAGQNLANPTALLLSALLMLDHIQESDAAARIRRALTRVLERGEVRTRDLGGTAKTGVFAQAICREIERG